MNRHPSSVYRTAGNILINLGVVGLIGGSGAKLAHVPKVVQQMAEVGFYGDRLLSIGILELLGALLLLAPRFRRFGVIWISAYLGGAIATHVQHGQSFLLPAIVLALLWLGVWLRHPDMLWSMADRSAGALGSAPAHSANATYRR